MDLSRTRRTNFWPNVVGRLETRKSTSLFSKRTLNLPSCGTRFSVMSRFEIILIRARTAFWFDFGMLNMSCRAPSMRYLTRRVPYSGSIWMSDALPLSACVSIRFTSLTIGAVSLSLTALVSSISSYLTTCMSACSAVKSAVESTCCMSCAELR